MSYIVYEKCSTKRIDNLRGGPEKESFKSMASAKAARTRFLKGQTVWGINDILITDNVTFYREIEKDVEVEVLMGDKKTTIKANTPWCCNPASETYWSS